MTRPVPVLALVVAVAFAVLTTGCTSTVRGVAVEPDSSVPADDSPPLKEPELNGLMLSNKELSKIAGVEMVSGSLNGTCQHAMGVVSNLIVEGFSCDVDDRDDALKITSQILDDAADR